MRKYYIIYKIIYWLLIFIPSMLVVIILLLFAAGSLFNGLMRYSHLKDGVHPNIIEAPVDFSKKGSYSFSFDYTSQSADDVLLLKLRKKNSEEFKSPHSFPLKINYIFNHYNAEKKIYEEESRSFTYLLSGVNRFIIDRYIFLKEGKNQLIIEVEKPCPELKQYSQTLILNDLFCLDGMEEVWQSFLWAAGMFCGTLAIVSCNVILIYYQIRKRKTVSNP